MYVSIKRSTQKDKKYTAVFYDSEKRKVKTIHFGAVGYDDYTTHHDEERKKNYIQRHRSRENWNDPMTAGSLSYHILWTHKSIKTAISSYINKFDFKLLQN